MVYNYFMFVLILFVGSGLWMIFDFLLNVMIIGWEDVMLKMIGCNLVKVKFCENVKNYGYVLLYI